jgi:hypothetical protein
MVGGFAMGLAGSIHCSCVCGGIASSLLLAASPNDATPASQLRALASIQTGRAFTYAAGGAIVAAAGSSFAGLLHLAGWQPVVRVAAAAVIVIVGLSMAGVLPQQGFARLAGGMFGRIRQRIPSGAVRNIPMVSGMLWGLTPCGMVYNALMMAMVAGSAINGALFMSGFALATTPAVSLAAYGSVRAVRGSGGLVRPPRMKALLGTLVAVFGMASAVFPAHSLTNLCFPG